MSEVPITLSHFTGQCPRPRRVKRFTTWQDSAGKRLRLLSTMMTACNIEFALQVPRIPSSLLYTSGRTKNLLHGDALPNEPRVDPRDQVCKSHCLLQESLPPIVPLKVLFGNPERTSPAVRSSLHLALDCTTDWQPSCCDEDQDGID